MIDWPSAIGGFILGIVFIMIVGIVMASDDSFYDGDGFWR